MFRLKCLYRIRAHYDLRHLRTFVHPLRSSYIILSSAGGYPRNSSSLTFSGATQERQPSDELKIQPVPLFRDALFNPRHEGSKSSLREHTDKLLHAIPLQKYTDKLHHASPLRTSNDGQRLLSEKKVLLESQFGSGDTTTPSAFNIVIGRLHRLGLRLRPGHIFHGMISAAEDPAALKQHLSLLKDTVSNSPSSMKIDKYRVLKTAARRFGGSKSFFQVIAQKIGDAAKEKEEMMRQPLIGSTWEQCRRHAQWLSVITGRADRHESQGMCLFDLGPALDFGQWPLYMDLVGCLFSEEIVYREYTRFERQRMRKKFFWSFYMNLQKKKKSEVVEDVISSTIGTLGTYGDLDRFWQLAQELGPRLKSEHLLKMLQYHLCKMEEKIGVRWVGGADGYHAPTKADSTGF